MSVKNFADLATFAARSFPTGYPVEDHITLYAEDNIPGALAFFVDHAEHSLALAMPDMDNDTLATATLRKLEDRNIFVLLCLGTPPAGHREKAFRATMAYPTNLVAFGHAQEYAFAAMDGLDSFDGSEGQLTFIRHPMVAFRVRHKIDLLYSMRKAGGGEQ